jgi:hypothetical protein
MKTIDGIDLRCATGSASAEFTEDADAKGHWQSQWHTFRAAF